jgi:hypothetical protein
MPNELQIQLRVPPAVKNALIEAAECDQRSVHGYLEKIVGDHLRASGFLPPLKRSAVMTQAHQYSGDQQNGSRQPKEGNGKRGPTVRHTDADVRAAMEAHRTQVTAAKALGLSLGGYRQRVARMNTRPDGT